MNKFKVGDFVIPKKFKSDGRFEFIPSMEPLTGKVHQIDSVYPGGLYYRVGNFIWPESALTLVNPQTLVSEPSRKTFGDFMLAALTGLASNSGYSDNNWPDDWDDYVDRLATGSKEIAKAAFELYEKEWK